MKSILYYSFFTLAFFAMVQSCQSTNSLSKTTASSSSANSAEQKLRSTLISEATRYKGTRYKAAGKDPKGFDCSGFTSYVYGKHDIALSSSSSSQSKQGIEIPISKAKPGDLLFFGPKGRTGRIQHVGIVYQNNKEGLFMIHSSSKRGIVIDNVSTSTYWKPKLLFARKVID